MQCLCVACAASTLVQRPCSDRRVWLDGVLPLVMDRESSAAEKCLEILDEVVLGNIVPYQRYLAIDTFSKYSANAKRM